MRHPGEQAHHESCVCLQDCEIAAPYDNRATEAMMASPREVPASAGNHPGAGNAGRPVRPQPRVVCSKHARWSPRYRTQQWRASLAAQGMIVVGVLAVQTETAIGS